MKYRVLREGLAVCQLAAGARVPEWALGGGFFCVTRTAEELSIVCEEGRVPEGVRVERDWVGLKLEGPFPFSMTGVLTSFLGPLAEAGIPIFAVATFDTDYVLMKREKLEQAVRVLGAAGHARVRSDANFLSADSRG
ncbi:MAG: ACT domain-containing protein [Acidobacteriales bacterium]|nr:ACT domain-containing protein [Candidatus Koribacter versatilis]MBI3645790.1 ACT domain-containing protein [Terriglobales bacterium]